MVWKTLGILLVGPMLGITLVSAWRTHNPTSALARNLAIVF